MCGGHTLYVSQDTKRHTSFRVSLQGQHTTTLRCAALVDIDLIARETMEGHKCNEDCERGYTLDNDLCNEDAKAKLAAFCQDTGMDPTKGWLIAYDTLDAVSVAVRDMIHKKCEQDGRKHADITFPTPDGKSTDAFLLNTLTEFKLVVCMPADPEDLPMPESEYFQMKVAEVWRANAKKEGHVPNVMIVTPKPKTTKH